MTNGIPLALTASPLVIHILDAAPTQGDRNGRPFTDVVTLYIQNSDVAAPAVADVKITPPGGTPVVLTVTIPASSTFQVFDETALGGTPLGSIGSPPIGGSVIAIELTTGAAANAWGWFVRS